MAASNTPSPPGEALAKPSKVADTKITASLMKAMCGSSGISTYIAAAQKEIDDPDHDLEQRQRPARQRHHPVVAADHARLDPHPGHIANQEGQHGDAEHPVEPDGK